MGGKTPDRGDDPHAAGTMRRTWTVGGVGGFFRAPGQQLPVAVIGQLLNAAGLIKFNEIYTLHTTINPGRGNDSCPLYARKITLDGGVLSCIVLLFGV